MLSECEIKEPADMVNDEELARALYRKSCVIVDVNSEDIKLMSTKEHVEIPQEE